MLRYTFQFSLITIALLAPMASARAITVVPQQTGAGAGGRATTVRTRCSTCGSNTVRDSILRQRLERLSLRSDSLRWQIENVHLSSAERERVAAELNGTVLMIKATLDALSNAPDVVAGQTPVAVRSGGGSGAAIARTAPSAVAGARVPGGFAMAYESWKPRGYLGATLDGPSTEEFREGQQFVRFYQYPRIALVDPSSPAERAGVLVGDTLLALDGTDVRKEISLTRLLVPDSRIKVRVRRDGDDRDLNVTVLESPEYYQRRAVPLPRTPQPSEQSGRVEVFAPGIPRSSQPPPQSQARTPQVWIITEGVAGARLQTISEGLGKALGVREGVLVLGVTPGPAYMAGVREGDVILKADGQTVPSVRALQEILGSADGEEGVKLVIMREKKQRTLTLHWR